MALAVGVVEFEECVFCFEPLQSVALCTLWRAGRRVCRHFHHLECMQRDHAYVRQHGGRDSRCPVCNEAYDDVVKLPVLDANGDELFAAVASPSGLGAREAKDLLRATLWLDAGAVEDLVDGRFPEAVGHVGITSAVELVQLYSLASSLAPGAADEASVMPHTIPLLVDDARGWFDYWASDAVGLSRDALVRALIKTLGTGDEERDELRAAVDAVWGLFCGEAATIGQEEFVSDDGMADALLAAMAGALDVEDSAQSEAFWACRQCTLQNPVAAVRCAACEMPHQEATVLVGAQSPPASARSFISAAPSSGPVCHACGEGLFPGRVDDRAGCACARCRRRPPVGAALWRCGCGAALCVRCATLGAHSQQRRAWPECRPEPEDSVQEEVRTQEDAQLNDSTIEGPTAVPPEPECPHCHRRKPPTGTHASGRWCRCAVDVTPASMPALPRVKEPVVEVVHGSGSAQAEIVPACSNCNRPRAPEGTLGWRQQRWCHCSNAPGSDLREYFRAQQLLRTSSRNQLSR